ncbi:uncharacterized protein LOC135476418 isoform X2 [Liolophura sinensis]|uniref:uncharacterized protein LOC135476418 isoform X2 n=1 Tax=Liolophura sinensis TaxID=3198878 RepID=UPI003158259A
MDRLIAPIFNITKRPRQALVSDPFDSQSTALSISNGPTATHTGPMHRTQPGSWNQGRTNPSMMTALLPPKPSLPQYQSKKMAKAGSNLHVTQNQSYSKAAPPTRKVTVTGGQIRALSAGQTNFQSSNMNNTRQGTSQPQASSFPGFQGNKTSFNQKRQYQQSGQDWPNRTTSHTAQMGLSTMSSVNQLSHVSQVSSARSSFPSQQKFSTQAFNRSQIQSQSQNSNITRCSSPQPSTSYATSLTSKQKAYHNNKQDIDKSLRVLTGTALSSGSGATHHIQYLSCLRSMVL